jgi:hypothetical protein
MPPSAYGATRRGDGGASVVRRETGDQTDQESRSAGRGAARSVAAMDIAVHGTFLPHDDPDACPALYPDTLGSEIRRDCGELTIATGRSMSGLPVRH